MHDSRIPREFTERINEANRLYLEAFLSFLPESSRDHLSTIQSEFSALCKDCLMQAFFTSRAPDSSPKANDTGSKDSRDTQKVKKVIIE